MRLDIRRCFVKAPQHKVHRRTCVRGMDVGAAAHDHTAGVSQPPDATALRPCQQHGQDLYADTAVLAPAQRGEARHADGPEHLAHPIENDAGHHHAILAHGGFPEMTDQQAAPDSLAHVHYMKEDGESFHIQPGNWSEEVAAAAAGGCAPANPGGQLDFQDPMRACDAQQYLMGDALVAPADLLAPPGSERLQASEVSVAKHVMRLAFVVSGCMPPGCRSPSMLRSWGATCRPHYQPRSTARLANK